MTLILRFLHIQRRTCFTLGTTRAAAFRGAAVSAITANSRRAQSRALFHRKHGHRCGIAVRLGTSRRNTQRQRGRIAFSSWGRPPKRSGGTSASSSGKLVSSTFSSYSPSPSYALSIFRSCLTSSRSAFTRTSVTESSDLGDASSTALLYLRPS